MERTTTIIVIILILLLLGGGGYGYRAGWGGARSWYRTRRADSRHPAADRRHLAIIRRRRAASIRRCVMPERQTIQARTQGQTRGESADHTGGRIRQGRNPARARRQARCSIDQAGDRDRALKARRAGVELSPPWERTPPGNAPACAERGTHKASARGVLRREVGETCARGHEGTEA